MIRRIDKIKGLGIFRDYQADTNLPSFERYNLIYGWNGCGKTSLSRLFTALEKGNLEGFPDLEYQLITEGGVVKQQQPYTRNVKVFNQEYISENSPSLENPSAETKHIFILGKEDKDLATQIEKEAAEKVCLNELLTRDDKKAGVISLNTQKDQSEKSKGKLFTDIARTIASSKGRAFRDYNKINALKVYSTLKQKEELSQDDLEKCQSMIEQKILEKIDAINLPSLQSNNNGVIEDVGVADQITILVSETKSLLAQTVQQNAIKRLTENSDIAEWVAIGIEVHKSHSSKICEYCNQPIPEKRAEELAGHFNDAHKTIIKSIEEITAKLREVYYVISHLKLTDRSNLYEPYKDKYEECHKGVDDARQTVLDEITELGSRLNEKKVKTHKSVNLDSDIDINLLVERISLLNEVLDQHNQMTDNFEITINTSKEKLERHFVSTIYDEAQGLDNELVNIDKQITLTNERIEELSLSISNAEAKIRNTKIACEKLNKYLEQFLGRAEITFEDSENGYLIRRCGKSATNLSEGEKTAIAFVYFIISLESKDFKLDEGIVLVDDPVSSFDSNCLFQAFAFLKNSLAEAHQLFIVTHNFEFLRLLMNWLNHDRRANNNKCYLMINNRSEADERCAFICKLDKLLQEHESEYHYLFKIIKTFESDGSIESAYNIPNIARKVLETFLMFRVPNGKSTYEKLQSITFDENKKTAIYKFTNDQSHITGKGFDPSLVPEAQKNVKYLLQMIEDVFPDHYRILTESLTT